MIVATRNNRVVALALLCGLLAACHGYQTHPGAINITDSKIYDVMSAAKTIEKEATPKFASGDLPVSLKPAFNAVMRSYNTALPLYKTWQDAERSADSKAEALLKELTKNIDELKVAIAAFNGSGR